MADHIDREYELVNQNYHPAQLFAYELQNKHIRNQNEAAEALEKGEKTFDDALLQELKYIQIKVEVKLPKKPRSYPQVKKFLLKK